jgi:hypothetical protein
MITKAIHYRTKPNHFHNMCHMGSIVIVFIVVKKKWHLFYLLNMAIW